MAIITLAEYKIWSGITGTADDSRLQVLIDSAHAALRRYCGRNLTNGFESATRTEDYEVDAAELQLKEWPVTSITSITPIDDDNNLGTALETTAYHADLSTGVVYYNQGQNGRMFIDDKSLMYTVSDWKWRPNFERVRVVYVSEAAPSDIDMALYRMVDTMYAAVQRGADIKSESVGQHSVTFVTAQESLEMVSSMLSAYRTARVG